MAFSLAELAQIANARVEGDSSIEITSVATLNEADEGAITFLTNRKYARYLADTAASAVILTEQDVDKCPVAALVTDNPHAAYARISRLFDGTPQPSLSIHPSAQVSESATLGKDVTVAAGAVIDAEVVIGDGTYIGANSVIGQGVIIGTECRINANVTLYHGCTVGNRCIIHSGTVIGADGFGFALERGEWLKVHQLGAVVIENDVEIGANSTVDRGAINDTVIHRGVKIDNQVQVAHNVTIGENTVIAGCVGIAGSTRLGKQCAIGGGAGILGHLELVDGVTISPTSLVTGSISEPGVYSSGVPLEATAKWRKNYARFKQLDEMAKRIKQLENELKKLERSNP